MIIKTNVKKYLKIFLRRFGYEMRKFRYEKKIEPKIEPKYEDLLKLYSPFTRDIGREYEDPPSVLPHFTLKKAPPTPWSGNDTLFIINNGKDIYEEVVYYSHLTLLEMCKYYKFHAQ